MKFIHMADVHFGRPFENIPKKKIEDDLRKAQRNAFKKVIDIIKEEETDYLFISGDLFEQKYVEDETIKYIISLFESIKETQIFIAPGNHDPLIKSSPYNTFSWPENVYIFSNDLGIYEFDRVCIYGFGFDNYEKIDNNILPIPVDKEKVNILITHGTLNGNSLKYNDIKERDIKNFDYVALGHIHLPKIDNSAIIYPGSLVPLGFDEIGKRGVIKGEIIFNGEDSSTIEYQFEEISEKQFDVVELDISNYNSIYEIEDAISLKDNHYYKIILAGTKNIDVLDVIDTMMKKENVIRIEDQTRCQIDLEELSKQDNLKGIFVKKMLEEAKNNPSNSTSIYGAIDYVLNI